MSEKCEKCTELEKEIVKWKEGYCFWHNMFHRQYIFESRMKLEMLKEREAKYPELHLPLSEARIKMEEGLIELEKGWGMEVVDE